MLLSEGLSVKYKNMDGVIAFVSDHSISILVSQGKHKSQDVRVVVYHSDFHQIHPLEEK
jgi:hypothetical protein